MARECICNDNRKYHLVKLRNPWGGHEWKGKWSDYDKTSWSKVDREHSEQGVESDMNPEDGMFFMEWNEFLSIFTTISVSRAHMGVTRATHATTKYEHVVARP